MTKRIYIASSWVMKDIAIRLAKRLRLEGFEVDCFCDGDTGKYVFYFPEIVGKHPEEWNAIRFVSQPQVKRAFEEDKKWLDWCDTCILLVPSGRSSHLEAGYAKGCGKKLYIYGEFPQGEFDVMYRFANGLYPFDTFDMLLEELKAGR